MTDEVSNQTLVLAVSVIRVTEAVLRDQMKHYLNGISKGSRTRHATISRGRQTLSKLQSGNAELTSIAITEANIKSFERYARKYHVTYALKKDRNACPPKYYVFFKARDADALHAAFQEFVEHKELSKARPSLKKRLMEKMMDAADLNKQQKRVKNMRREVER